MTHLYDNNSDMSRGIEEKSAEIMITVDRLLLQLKQINEKYNSIMKNRLLKINNY